MSRSQERAPSGRATARPATDPHTLNTALRAWASAIDQVSDLVFMHDEGGYLMRVNHAYAAKAGLPSSGLLGRSFRDVLPQDTASVDASAPCTDAEYDIVLAGGEVFSCRTLPLHDDAGGTPCCIHFLRQRSARAATAGGPASERSESSEGRLRRSLEATVEAFAATIELKDPVNGSHGRRVAALAAAIGKDLPLTAAQLEGIRLAALIHDLGSFKIPLEVLVKPGKLTAVERLLVQSHPEVAHRILQGIDFPWPIAEIILQHHERIDGTGYPRGLTGSQMLTEAKVLAVSDAMEAMLSDRPYRPSLGVAGALAELTEHRGTFYDPSVVDACVRLFAEQGFELPGEPGHDTAVA